VDATIEGAIEHATWPALGTTVQVIVSGGDVEPARAAVADLLERVDRTYSRFRSDSELSRLNSRPGETVTASPLLALALDVALRAARQSDGRVDPTVGRAMRAVGYDEDFGRLASRSGPIELRLEQIPGWRAVRFDRASRSVRLSRGVELDLGSTGKALASDLAAAAALGAIGRGGALVSLGGDIAIAGEAPTGGWRVLVAEDSSTPTTADGEVVALRVGAIATSSTTVRRWTRDGVRLHHLIDPATGLPADSPWRTVTVAAASCVDANIAATAAIVRGGSAPDWLAGLGLAARLVANDGTVRRVGGWPAPMGA
jgi:thiamine biosynthesis lipoprotein ApbE